MGIYGDRDLDSVLAPFLVQSGYEPAPRQFSFAFVKQPLALVLSYDPRDNASLWFGKLEQHIDPIFGDFSPLALRKSLHPFEYWLRLTGQDPKRFSSALGGWEDGGLRLPDFAYLSEVVLRNLAGIETMALTHQSTRTR